MTPLDGKAVATLFTEARTFTHWLERPIPDGVIERALELAQLGPTSGNCEPMRLVLVRSPAGKARLLPCVSSGNSEKVRTAPLTAIVAYDREFYEYLPRLYPHSDARGWFTSNAALAPKPRSATARCKAPISSWRCARWGSIAGRCRASTTPRSTPNSSPAAGCAAISS